MYIFFLIRSKCWKNIPTEMDYLLERLIYAIRQVVMIDTLKTKYSLPRLLGKLRLSKSIYYYQEKVLSQPGKYFSLRIRIKELLIGDKENVGAKSENGALVRQILDEYYRGFQGRKILNYLCVVILHSKPGYKTGKKHKIFDNLLKQNFSIDCKNKIWCTDFTYMRQPNQTGNSDITVQLLICMTDQRQHL